MPTVELSATASDPDGDELSVRWEASGGVFESTGTSTLTTSSPGQLVNWVPDRQAGEYTIQVRVSDGEGEATESIAIDVEPSIVGNWLGTIGLTNEEFERAGFCMVVYPGGQVVQYGYAEVRTGPGTTGTETGGQGNVPSQYDYPALNVTFRDGSDGDGQDEALTLAGQLESDGATLQSDLELESGVTRRFDLERTTTCATLTDVLRSEL